MTRILVLQLRHIIYKLLCVLKHVIIIWVECVVLALLFIIWQTETHYSMCWKRYQRSHIIDEWKMQPMTGILLRYVFCHFSLRSSQLQRKNSKKKMVWQCCCKMIEHTHLSQTHSTSRSSRQAPLYSIKNWGRSSWHLHCDGRRRHQYLEIHRYIAQVVFGWTIVLQ